jgi:cell division protein FtsI/penicillin-binding protein 2
MLRSRIAPWALALCLVFLALIAIPTGGARAGGEPEAAALAAIDGSAGAAAAATSPRAEERPTATVAPVRAEAQPVLGPATFDSRAGRYTATYGGSRASLSVSPRLQQGLEKLLAGYRVPLGAVVVLEPRTGRVLAIAEHAEKGPRAHIALQPVAPAASVFKLVTSAALLERGIGPDEEVCFHGGRHRIQKALLSDDPRRDRRCLTLSSALGKSANVVFAKLAGRELSAELLREEAGRFLFNAPIPFAWTVEPSPAQISDDPFQLATTAAGFGPVRLSPLHGALLAGIVANGGRFVPPRIVDEVDGEPVAPPGEPREVVRPEIAAALARMMATTTTEGTARKIFRRDRTSRRSPLREVTVAGKTGSLADASPYRDYSWFVGFAPVQDPQVAVAAVVVNERRWRVKAALVAHEALKAYFEAEGVRPVRTAAR